MVAFFACPLPYYVEYPGAAKNVADYVKVDGKTSQAKGKLMLVYVNMMQATPFMLLKGWITPFYDIETKSESLGTNTIKEYDAMEQYYMQDAVNQAQYVALNLAHQPVTEKFYGLGVITTTKNSDFKGKLQPGDLITKLDGKSYPTLEAFMQALKQKDITKPVTLTVLRQKKTLQITGKLQKINSKQNGLGITMMQQVQIQTPKKIEANMQDIGGPSAGLMLTLQLYEQLAQKDLTKGRKIAGTGTIAQDGHVGDIGGIDKKVVASAKAGATVFFAPNNPVSKAQKKADPAALTNYQEAKRAASKIKTNMKIVSVRNIQDALKYLENND